MTNRLLFLAATCLMATSPLYAANISEQKKRSWASSVFMSMGYVLPTGFLAEAGYTISDWVTLSVLLNMGGSWVKQSGVYKLGFAARLHAPVRG